VQALSKSYEQLRKRDESLRALSSRTTQLSSALHDRDGVADECDRTRQQLASLTKQLERVCYSCKSEPHQFESLLDFCF
jgi:hypothetical protein